VTQAINAEAAKAERERRVFQAFIQKETALEISPQTIESRRPPEPDILCCTRGGEFMAFELAEICDSEIARRIPPKDAKEPVFIRGSDPTFRILEAKLRKTYTTACPIDLLCYNAGRVISPDDVILNGISRAIGTNHGQFRRIWLLADQCRLVWSGG
jgi:hypothetical protein